VDNMVSALRPLLNSIFFFACNGEEMGTPVEEKIVF
jgi:hypothetical protein